MDKENMICTYHRILVGLKKKGHSDIWVNFKDILLSEISLSEKDKYYDSNDMRYQW